MSTLWSASNHVQGRRKWRIYLKPAVINYSDGKQFDCEPDLDQIKFHVHSFTSKQGKNLFIFALVEFGCELFLPHYFLKELKNIYQDHRLVVIGWHGRAFLYQNLVDEFWELDESHMWLRETVRAFLHVSRNIKNLEKLLRKQGDVFESYKFGNMVLENVCNNCGNKFGSEVAKSCPSCLSLEIKKSMFSDLAASKQKYTPIDYSNQALEEWASKIIGPNVVGIFARNRKTYGRNLDAKFYIDLIWKLRQMGMEPVWLGERQSTLPCPVDDIFDFTVMRESLDLRYTLALVSKCVCTFQCWTASTRLSQITNTPYVLVETADQIYGRGHEGKRLFLFTRDLNKKKLILCNFHKVRENPDQFLDICANSIYDFVINHDASDVLGLVDNSEYASKLQAGTNLWKTNLKMIISKDM